MRVRLLSFIECSAAASRWADMASKLAKTQAQRNRSPINPPFYHPHQRGGEMNAHKIAHVLVWPISCEWIQRRSTTKKCQQKFSRKTYLSNIVGNWTLAVCAFNQMDVQLILYSLFSCRMNENSFLIKTNITYFILFILLELGSGLCANKY